MHKDWPPRFRIWGLSIPSPQEIESVKGGDPSRIWFFAGDDREIREGLDAWRFGERGSILARRGVKGL